MLRRRINFPGGRCRVLTGVAAAIREDDHPRERLTGELVEGRRNRIPQAGGVSRNPGASLQIAGPDRPAVAGKGEQPQLVAGGDPLQPRVQPETIGGGCVVRPGRGAAQDRPTDPL